VSADRRGRGRGALRRQGAAQNAAWRRLAAVVHTHCEVTATVTTAVAVMSRPPEKPLSVEG